MLLDTWWVVLGRQKQAHCHFEGCRQSNLEKEFLKEGFNYFIGFSVWGNMLQCILKRCPENSSGTVVRAPCFYAARDLGSILVQGTNILPAVCGAAKNRKSVHNANKYPRLLQLGRLVKSVCQSSVGPAPLYCVPTWVSQQQSLDYFWHTFQPGRRRGEVA